MEMAFRCTCTPLSDVHQVAGSYPATPKGLTGIVSLIPAIRFPLFGLRAGPPAVVEGLPELVLVGPLVALEHCLGRLPAAELAEDLERLVH